MGQRKPLFSFPSVHKQCLFILFLQSETLAMKLYFDQCADRSPSGPRVEFLRADMRIKVLDIIYLKIWKSLRTWDHSWQPKKKKQNWLLCSQCAKTWSVFSEPSWRSQEKVRPREIAKMREREEKERPIQCPNPSLHWYPLGAGRKITLWHSNAMAVNSHGEKGSGSPWGGAICKLQVPSLLLFTFVTANND